MVYTKGPWKVTTDEDWESLEIRMGSAITSPGNYYSGELWKCDADDEIATANARLIAAAPDLLEALKNLERTSGVSAMHDDPSRIAARKAIAKAMGES